MMKYQLQNAVIVRLQHGNVAKRAGFPDAIAAIQGNLLWGIDNLWVFGLKDLDQV